jgi:hypothetical protein
MFLDCYIPGSNCCWLKLHKPLIIILRDDPIEHLFFTLTNSGLLISSKAVGKLLVEPKTLGWVNTLGKEFKRVFEKPWSSIYSTEMFSKGFLGQREKWVPKGKKLMVF